jgi:A/G-specific adenine glycosylase
MNQPVRKIIDWYDRNKRDLPWRSVNDPYLIWVSEVILQQTRVAQGLSYYTRFVSRFPDPESLALASQGELMKMWEGLGYYSRAINMQAAAKSIVREHHGRFPSSYDSILKLKGTGEYTASAVASIAFGLPYAVTDGNVTRFISRFYGIDKPVDTLSVKNAVKAIAREILDISRPGTHNQALMEFGALVCIPLKPDCRECPVSNGCFAYRYDMVSMLPLKTAVKNRLSLYFYFLVCENEYSLLIEKRNAKGIWKNLYQFPLFESEAEMTDEQILSLPLCRNFLDKGGILKGISRVYRHELTHRRIMARFITIRIPPNTPMIEGFIETSKEEIRKFAFPVLVKNYMTEKGII